VFFKRKQKKKEKSIANMAERVFKPRLYLLSPIIALTSPITLSQGASLVDVL
jgi:hypothetical protein